MKNSRISVRDIVVKCCLSCILLLQACDNSNDGVEFESEFYGNAEIIRIDPKNDIDEEYSMKASLIVSSIDYFPLTLPGDMVIGEVAKMIHHNGHVYIFDRHTASVFIFTDEGEFINAIQSKGEGPEEYGDINDFEVEPRSGNVLIYSPMSQKILKYTIKGEYLGAMRNKARLSSFFPISDSAMVMYNSRLPNEYVFESTFPIQPRFFIANDAEEIEKQDLETTYREQLLMYPVSGFGFYEVGDSLRLMESINTVIYKVDLAEGRVYPRFGFDFTNVNPPRLFDMEADELSTFMEDYKNKKVGGWATLYKVSETADFLCVTYFYDKYVNRTFYSKNTKRLINIGSAWINDMDNISMPSVETVTVDGEFIGYFNSNDFSRMVRNNNNKLSQRILDLEKSQRDAESIILVKFRLKDF
ncbi:6-bladed beta-propeller [Belliella kenyensis]|uniref:6-bladed beta-propeller n=1 Tax=Belliella kenyensis TaxID=1472724 RepID=A0ABV8ENB1_9BACT|nr:6-bladed beta-propeller [Belliella kenyensis]MCH7402027.1 6-bladed beta-propeller [Belliella kenyensis]MDN3605191.1 6-bladed beta-propeller [Belliella kenyensis]